MRVIHLCFQLHEPYELKLPNDEKSQDTEAWGESVYFDSAERFKRVNKEVYQPFFALLERNIQKHRDLHFSLIVSGAWLDQAEKYDHELIERLKKIVKLERVELISEPYYHSLAFFYAKDELTEQVQQYQAKIEQLFGVKGRIFALPELIYNDAAGKWAEEAGFAGMLVGGSARALDWRSPNHVYEAAGCEYLRLLVRNWRLSDLIEQGDESLWVEKKTDDGEKKLVLSVAKFRKLLDLDFLRGNLANLYFDTQMFARQRERGVIGFFDELIATWLEDEKNKFATAAEACMVETPTAELSIQDTVSWRGDAEEDAKEAQVAGLVLKSEVENKLPKWLARNDQVVVSKMIYGARRQILASEDEKLATDLRRLTLVDYHKCVDSSLMAKVSAIVDDLKRRAEEIKKTQAVKISRAYTKKRDRGDIERKIVPESNDGIVQVNFGKKPKPAVIIEPEVPEETHGLEVVVLDGAGESDEVNDVDEMMVDDMDEIVSALDAEGVKKSDGNESKAEEIPVTQKRKTHAVRKIIKKLVIE